MEKHKFLSRCSNYSSDKIASQLNLTPGPTQQNSQFYFNTLNERMINVPIWLLFITLNAGSHPPPAYKIISKCKARDCQLLFWRLALRRAPSYQLL